MAVRLLLVLSAAIVTVSSAGLLETLLAWDLPETEARSTVPSSKCLCQTSSCLCCVNLNLTTTIDLGGPACLNVNQKEENVTLNMSYGDNAVHNATIKIVEAANKPTCMNLLSDLAQLCARFVSIRESGSGYDGCLVIEPALLGSPQATYQVGCFNFNQGVRQIETSTITEATEVPTENAEEDDDAVAGINTDELIAAVSASAEHGIALFSQWLGLSLNPKLNLTSESSSSSSSSSTSSRSAREMADSHLQDKNDERFKQLLSAQDNVQKESARIGHSDGLQTTFVYSNEPRTPEVEQLAVVSRESRRGGRAYDIHRHVNEV